MWCLWFTSHSTTVVIWRQDLSLVLSKDWMSLDAQLLVNKASDLDTMPFRLLLIMSVSIKRCWAAPVAKWLRSLTSVLLIIRSSHRCGFAPRMGHKFICETSHVLLAGVSGGFSPGTPVFRPTYRLIHLDMSEKA